MNNQNIQTDFNMGLNSNILHSEHFQRSNKYDTMWIFKNQMGPNPLWLTEFLTQPFDLKPGMRVLDLGCGKGMTSVFLAREFGVQVYAVQSWDPPDDIWNNAKEYGVEKVRVTIVRRGGDPGDIKSGPIDALVLDPVKLPSHHGPDVKTIMPHINITSSAIKAPTTFMHLHVLNIKLRKECTADEVKKLFSSRPRIRLIADGISSTAEIIECGRDIGRPRNDMWENCIFKDSISVDDGELYFFQAIHQESDVIPENIDAIRAMMKLEKDNMKSIEKTNKAMGIH